MADIVYDYCIVGAGLAGLHCALRISTKYAKANILMIDMYSMSGGRVSTHYEKGSSRSSWEKGAGRIHTSHRMIGKYVDSYGLTRIPISSHSEWLGKDHQKTPNYWPAFADYLYSSLSALPQTTLQTKTIRDILGPEKTKEFLNYFPYNSELTRLRADLALQSIHSELKGDQGQSFYTVQEGLSELINRMEETLRSRGVTFLFNHRLVSLKSAEAAPLRLEFVCEKKPIHILCKKSILAIPSEGLKKIPLLRSLPILKSITMTPLLRIYGVFSENPSWFSKIPKTVTDSPIKHFIPVGKHITMLSYTDADDTTLWADIRKKYGDAYLERRIIAESEKLFQRKIPSPHSFHVYYWKEGCSYWLPGLYDPVAHSKSIMNPLPMRFPNVYVCGESYSLKQAWMEGALEHAEQMLNSHIL
jgi:hypothetical protein